MVFLTLTRKINKVVGPFLLRNGVALRYALGGGIVRDSPTLDSLLMISLAQKLVTLEVHDDLQRKQRKLSPLDEWADKTFDRIFGHDEEEKRIKRMPQGEFRVMVLETYLRRALVKNERWSDLLKWRFHNRLVGWARKEFLIAKHGSSVQDALVAFPKLQYSPQLAINPMRRGVLKLSHGSEIQDATKKIALPTSSLVEDAFQMHDWKQKKDKKGSLKYLESIASRLGGKIIELRNGSLRFADIPLDADLSELTLEEILEIAGGHVAFCGPFNALCEERDIYQLWTNEYVAFLANYLLERTNDFEGETLILDVGAGDGLLAQYLTMAIGKEIREQSMPTSLSKRRQHRSRNKSSTKMHSNASRNHLKVPSIIAVDDGSWKIFQKASVEKLSVDEALVTYCRDPNSRMSQQVIVICSWMPMGVDWSALFRKYRADEYVLIGECDDGSCGDNWETWGNHAFLSDIEQELIGALSSNVPDSSSSRADLDQKATPPPYEVDGYRRIDLNELVPYQFSRFDSSVSKIGKTVTFRLKK